MNASHTPLSSIIDNYTKNLTKQPRWFANLTGKLTLFQGSDERDIYDNTCTFIFGPEDEGGYVSDTLSCDQFLTKVLDNLKASDPSVSGFTFDVGCSENSHEIQHPNLTEDMVIELMPKIAEAIKQALPSPDLLVVELE